MWHSNRKPTSGKSRYIDGFGESMFSIMPSLELFLMPTRPGNANKNRFFRFGFLVISFSWQFCTFLGSLTPDGLSRISESNSSFSSSVNSTACALLVFFFILKLVNGKKKEKVKSNYFEHRCEPSCLPCRNARWSQTNVAL